MREVLMPSSSDLFAPVLKNQKKSSQATIEGQVCFSSSLRNTTAREAVAHDFIVFFINTSRILSFFFEVKTFCRLSQINIVDKG